MGTFGPIHWLIVAVVVLLLFGGRGKISSMMGDTAKGIRAFREGLKGEDEAHEEEPEPAKPLPKSTTAKKTASRSTAKSKA
ncbi:MAG: twin-arginine translocase TatA/TatE family subunit [Proteobacteria bacterium]|nr:twin-arginine translocase TatA/TatE family subunit [Pseudomonadota bacterium]